MGLDIRSKNYKYSYSYRALHMIRSLTLLCVGLEKEYRGLNFFQVYMSCEFKENLCNTEIQGISFLRKKIGYLFPNLLFHSDCEGDYRIDGKINLNTLDSGNSKELLSELEIIKSDDDVKELFEENEYYRDLFNDFYNVVEECVKFRRIIKFR